MKKYIIVAETGSDIPKELANKYEIYLVPMHVTFGEEVNVFVFSAGYKINDLEWLEIMAEQTVLNELFRDKLSTYTSRYNVNEIERTENVRLASEFIDDVILMPGQEFSYNTIVGERSTERGFKTAKVYQQGQIVDGLGGGICQVSSTLYNAVVMADLEVLERRTIRIKNTHTLMKLFLSRLFVRHFRNLTLRECFSMP